MKALPETLPATGALLRRKARQTYGAFGLAGAVSGLLIVIGATSFICRFAEGRLVPELEQALTICLGVVVGVITIRRFNRLNWLTIASSIERSDRRFEHRLITLVSVLQRGKTSSLIVALQHEVERLAATHADCNQRSEPNSAA